jgi:hypothetical protein
MNERDDRETPRRMRALSVTGAQNLGPRGYAITPPTAADLKALAAYLNAIADLEPQNIQVAIGNLQLTIDTEPACS